ncbi:ylmG homolog protein 1-2, chloroplastic-like [Juglans microcarpa x Juglans regia]|uniref:ylmG homolog protein 1-2, chloroplastic-like n=1 Tax=Juglans microcarpa x Juglans regia TaxID=2249226 RepID=UPI001B7F533F|nr:ylmG homolog protein 1-2, chloroplastic-like [Juglans microcarpa x Juglans regia]XP_040993738.1 ylmG homolog protein 1-2, chloroplastic-like [Juglans microcarpa x Juglans regia]
MAPLITSQAVRNPLLLTPPNLKPTFYSPRCHLLSFHNPSKPLSPRLTAKRNLATLVLASASPAFPALHPRTPQIPTQSQSPLTQTLTTIAAIALCFSTLFSKLVENLAPQITQQVVLQRNLVSTVGPLFFAALKDRPTGYLNTPLTVVAAGLGKWLDIYSGVLMVRVLLSWFPNIPWDRQPLSAIRDLCDPYLNLFRNIIPPIFDTLDVSPLLAFAVLGTLGSILNSSRGVY